jgi:hypothetical protein
LSVLEDDVEARAACGDDWGDERPDMDVELPLARAVV